ncbi:MAG: hypothetical protein QXI12_06670 [Candidatus Methanomethyliaceae archaeon]
MVKTLIGTVPIYVLNTKDDDLFSRASFPSAFRTDTIEKVVARKYKLTIYTPTGEELIDRNILDEFLNDRYKEGRCIVVIDELSQVTMPGRDGVGFVNLLSRGRSRYCSVIMGTQRPAHVSRLPFSESQAFYVFRLNDRKDRLRVGEFTHPHIGEVMPERFCFWYYRTDFEEPYMMTPI